MKILVTGGAGFVGYHLCKKLTEDGDEVIVYDAFLNFADSGKSRYQEYLKLRLDYLKDKVKLVQWDIRNKDQLMRVLKETKPEVVVHLAALPIASLSDKVGEAGSINLDGTLNVLEAIRHSDSVKRFVYSSSSMVYGDFEKDAADESHPTRPVDIYGATKLSGEIFTRAYQKQYGLKATIIRLTSVYGPTDANRRVSQIFVENALLKKPITLHDGGQAALDFTFVEDVAEGFRLAIKSKKAENETFNISYGQARSLKDFVSVLGNIVPGITVKNEQADMTRPQRGTLDITKARKLLGFSPKYPLERGLEIYVDFVRKQLKR